MSTVDSKPAEITYNGVVYSTPFADLLRSLTAEEERELRDDIDARGVIIPIVVTEQNEVIDGANRLRIAAELGKTDLPIKVVRGLSEDKKRRLAVDLNAHRRQLSRADKQALIKRLLRNDPTRSDSAIAADAKVSDKTVAANRKKLEATSEIPETEKRQGLDGRDRPAKPKRTSKTKTVVTEPIANLASPEKQPGLFDGNARKTTDGSKPPNEQSYEWWSRLSGPKDILEDCHNELHKLTNLRIAEPSPSLIEPVINKVRKALGELEALAVNTKAA